MLLLFCNRTISLPGNTYFLVLAIVLPIRSTLLRPRLACIDILVGLRIPLLHVAVQVRRATRGGVVASRLPSTKVETVGGERGELTPGLHPMAGGPAS